MNILLIMTDQQRFDSLGCYGCEAIPTPNLDRLAREGVLFEHCYVNNPVCTPSRASIYTGKQLPGHGVYGLFDLLPRDEIMFPKTLQENGYETALFGKLHVSDMGFESEHRNQNDGYDIYNWNHEPVLYETSKFNSYAKWLHANHPDFYREYFARRRAYGPAPAELHCTTYLCEQTAEFIRGRTGDHPFFCCLSFFDPHNPYEDCPAEGRALVDVSKLPPVRYRPGETEGKPHGVWRESHHGYMGDFANFTQEQLREMQIGYYGSIAFFDLQLGKVFRALEDTGTLEDTMILFVSDHGDMLGDHELLAKGAFFYDACTRVPLLVRRPGMIDAGKREKRIVQPHDIAATVLQAAGLWNDETKHIYSDSQDLFDPALQGQEGSAVCIYRGTGICDQKTLFDPPIMATMLRTGRYKMNIYHMEEARGLQGELFDMEADPGEMHDLWRDPQAQDVKDEMLAAYIDWFVRYDYRCNAARGGSAGVTKIPMPK